MVEAVLIGVTATLECIAFGVRHRGRDTFATRSALGYTAGKSSVVEERCSCKVKRS
jgi:hypothetical protein